MSRRKGEDKRTADADRNTSLKSGQRRGGWERGFREGLERDRDETRRDRWDIENATRKQERAVPEVDLWRERIVGGFSSLSLSLFLLFSSVVWVGLERWRATERGETQHKEKRALISASCRYFRADRRDKKHLLRDAPISFVDRRLPARRPQKRSFRLRNAYWRISLRVSSIRRHVRLHKFRSQTEGSF